MGVREASEQDAIDDAEYSRCRSDAQRECANRCQRESPRSRGASECISHVLNDLFPKGTDVDPSRVFLYERATAELFMRFASRLVGRHAGTLIEVGAHLEMRFNLLTKVVIDL